MLAASQIAGPNPSRTLVMLHGIYGRGRNWLAIARGVVAARPEYACWLVDLPHHGTSPPAAHGDTVSGLAKDVIDWMRGNGIGPSALLGHSYGGKVVLAMGRELRDVPLCLWIIDSTPEVKAPSGSAWSMLQSVRALPRSFASREAGAEALISAGFTAGVAQWMTTNLTREGESFIWRLDFDAMERLLLDFFGTDLWNAVEAPPPRHEIHFVKASESSAISEDAVRRIQAAASDRVHLHSLQGGHWIHAESPDTVIALLVRHLS